MRGGAAEETHPELKLIAVGTNGIATSAMLKAGADAGPPGRTR